MKTDFNKWKDEDDSGSELDDDLYGAGGGDLNAVSSLCFTITPLSILVVMQMMQQMGGMGAGPAPPDPGVSNYTYVYTVVQCTKCGLVAN